MRRLTLILGCLLALAAAATALAGPAAARTGRCLPDGSGPACHFWTGKVTAVNDGDTIHVDLDGDRTHRAFSVRFVGVQAMEQTVYSHTPSKRRGECHALEATARLERMIRAGHGRVRLAAQDPASRAGHRLRRSVAVKIHGRWRDVGETLIREGYTLWMPGIVETAWNRTYNRLEEEAAARRSGMWNTSFCGRGPSQDVPLKVWAVSDPPGNDASELNAEWIKVENRSDTTPVALGGWWVRDSMLRRFTFPRGTILPPRGTVTVHTGQGTNSDGSFYWGLSAPIFENANNDGRDLGDGAYLFDPQGDLRVAMVYPCVVGCTDPNQGAIRISAEPRRRESVSLENVSSHPVDLYGYQLTKPGNAYYFGPSSVLEPGQTMQIDMQGDPSEDTPLERHWGIAHASLRDRGDSLTLGDFTGVTLACDAWGDAGC